MAIYWTNDLYKSPEDKRLLTLKCGCKVLRLGKKREFKSLCYKHARNSYGDMR